MGFFQKIRNALYRFMYGRNGMDQLNLALMILVLGMDVVAMLVQRRVPVLYLVLYWLSMALWLVVLFRMFSKNLYKRRNENQKWVNWLWKFKSSQAGARERHADKDHKYFTCKNCKTICRVPVGKGKVIITCPKCDAQIQGRT